MTAVNEDMPVRDTGTAGPPGGAVLHRLLVIAVVLAVGAGGVWLVARAAVPNAGPTTTGIPALRIEPMPVEPGSAAPARDQVTDGEMPDGASTDSPDPSGAPDSSKSPEGADSGVDTLTEWADRLADVVGIPSRALAAYGNAELVMSAQQPDCRLSWATLAGIGRIESDHSRYGGVTLGRDGRPSEPIIGIALDGSPGVKAIADTDGGSLDGDPRHDRAVGPMQFIPSTWKRFGVDASGDGLADPQQIDDAALSAARYLCAGSRDMATARGWWDGVLSYNNSTEYGRKVFTLADGYAKQARAVTG